MNWRILLCWLLLAAPVMASPASANAFKVENRQVATIDPLGNTNSITYNHLGKQAITTDALGRGTFYAYDPVGNLIQTGYPDGSVTRTTYDEKNRAVITQDRAMPDGSSNTTASASVNGGDFRGLLTSVTLAQGTPAAVTTTYGYDEAGTLEFQTNAAASTYTHFQSDQLGRRTVRTLPGGQSETNYYDVVGNLLRHTNFDGVILTNQYDVVNRLTNRTATNYQVKYTYTVMGTRQTMVDATGTNVWIYDALNRMVTNTTPQGVLRYGYDVAGAVTNIYSGTSTGVNLGYAYDCLGRLTNVTANTTNVANYTYDGVGNLAALGYANGVTNLYQYTEMNRLTNLVWNRGATVLANFGYQLGVAGNRTGAGETISGTNQTHKWTYDRLYRMTNETVAGAAPTGSISYGLDAVGNRTNRTSTVSGISTTNNAFDSNDRLTSDTYDANGNTVTSASINSQYDAEDRLTNYNSGAVIMTYKGDGTRVGKVVGGTTNIYLVDTKNPTGYPQVLEEWSKTGSATNLVRVYAYGTALINQRQLSGNLVTYYGTDGHGSVRFLTTTNGIINNSYTYDAFGIVTASNTPTANVYLYSGQQWDPDLGMYYLRARYYKPDSGRFWSMDTFEGRRNDPLSIHKYLYAADNPVNLRDPSGRWFDSTSTLFCGLTSFKTTSRDAATAESGRQSALKGIGLAYLLVTMNIVLTYEAGVLDTTDEMDLITLQTQRRVNPTGSPHAYKNKESTEFANDAMQFFKAGRRNPQRIRYDSLLRMTIGGSIMAADGFGLYGGENISIAGYHEGVLVDGAVFDNNVPFGVPRDIWENGYLITTSDTFRELTFRQPTDLGYGTISVR